MVFRAMSSLSYPLLVLLLAVLSPFGNAVSAKMPVASYKALPSLREQNAMEVKWVEKRYEHIQGLLEK
jgi:hypothetical protein